MKQLLTPVQLKLLTAYVSTRTRSFSKVEIAKAIKECKNYEELYASLKEFDRGNDMFSIVVDLVGKLAREK